MSNFKEQLQGCPQPWPTLQLGKKHWFVKLLRRVLSEHGYGDLRWKDPEVAVSDYFDGTLLAPVKAFQTALGLTADGIVGGKTWAALAGGLHEIPHPAPGGQYDEVAVRNTAADYNEFLVALGVKEHGSNTGEVVDAVNRHTLGHSGEPWCATVQDFCADTSAKVHQTKVPLDIGASASDLHRRAEKAGRLIPLEQVKRGHLFIVPGGGTGWRHVGMVLQHLPNGRIRTCEGNTNDDGSADGYEMCIRTRKAAGLAFVDWSRA